MHPTKYRTRADREVNHLYIKLTIVCAHSDSEIGIELQTFGNRTNVIFLVPTNGIQKRVKSLQLHLV